MQRKMLKNYCILKNGRTLYVNTKNYIFCFTLVVRYFVIKEKVTMVVWYDRILKNI